jgi:threonine dehydrogenase-like Zn-dependent dehydrogenase
MVRSTGACRRRRIRARRRAQVNPVKPLPTITIEVTNPSVGCVLDRSVRLMNTVATIPGSCGGTISLIGVYGEMADPLPMLTLFDKQVTLRRGQANVKKWVCDLMPLLTDDDPLGVDTFATRVLPLDEAPHAYEIFQKKHDGAVKVMLKP